MAAIATEPGVSGRLRARTSKDGEAGELCPVCLFPRQPVVPCRCFGGLLSLLGRCEGGEPAVHDSDPEQLCYTGYYCQSEEDGGRGRVPPCRGKKGYEELRSGGSWSTHRTTEFREKVDAAH